MGNAMQLYARVVLPLLVKYYMKTPTHTNFSIQLVLPITSCTAKKWKLIHWIRLFFTPLRRRVALFGSKYYRIQLIQPADSKIGPDSDSIVPLTSPSNWTLTITSLNYKLSTIKLNQMIKKKQLVTCMLLEHLFLLIIKWILLSNKLENQSQLQ